MAMSWHPLRRWIHSNEQAPTTEPDEHGLRVSEELRQRQELRRAPDAERDRTTRKNGQTTLGFIGGPGPGPGPVG